MARGGYCAGTKRLRRRLSPVRKPSETGAIPGAESMFSGRCRRFPGRAPPRTVLLEARSARSARSGAVRPAGARWKSRSGPSPLPDAETIPGAESIFSVSCGRLRGRLSPPGRAPETHVRPGPRRSTLERRSTGPGRGRRPRRGPNAQPESHRTPKRSRAQNQRSQRLAATFPGGRRSRIAMRRRGECSNRRHRTIGSRDRQVQTAPRAGRLTGLLADRLRRTWASSPFPGAHPVRRTKVEQ